MTPKQKLPDLQRREAVAPKCFDPRSATAFINKSVSEETRRAYRRAVADFFQFIGGKHPTEARAVDFEVQGQRGKVRGLAVAERCQAGH